MRVRPLTAAALIGIPTAVAALAVRAAAIDADAVRTRGRAVAAFVAKKDVAGLRARMTPYAARHLTAEKLESVFAQLFAGGATLGTPRRESAVAGPQPGIVQYRAEYALGPGRLLRLGILLDGDGPDARVAGLLFEPVADERADAPTPPDPRAGYAMKTPLRLPFAPGDVWTVGWGGRTREQNHHVVSVSQRHAYDFLIVRDGRTHDGDGTRLSQYYAWGRPILAPAEGTVVSVENAMPDLPPGEPSEPERPAGNHVLLDLGNDEYVLLGHLRKGSVRVRRGDRVKAGQTLGLCGNSGNTSQPHLHFHVQDKPYLFRDAVGLPATFAGYISDGRRVAKGAPVRGEVVRVGAATVKAAGGVKR